MKTREYRNKLNIELAKCCSAFEAMPSAPAVIVVEDDFLFSPDFIEFFESVGPVLERDPTTLVLSAWNDNGLKGKVSAGRWCCRSLRCAARLASLAVGSAGARQGRPLPKWLLSRPWLAPDAEALCDGTGSALAERALGSLAQGRTPNETPRSRLPRGLIASCLQSDPLAFNSR